MSTDRVGVAGDGIARDEALEDFAVALTAATGHPVPLPREAVERAASDKFYFFQLIASRGHPDEISRRLEAVVGKSPPKWAPPADLVLIATAGRALARWAAAGFGTVDETTLARRRDACLACEHLREPGPSLLYKLSGAGRSSICGLCSCAVERKIVLPTEACPVASPADPSVTLWGEPVE